MDAGALIGLLVTLAITVVSVVASLLITAVSVLVPLLVMGVFAYFLVKQLNSGQGAIVVHSPLLALAQQAAGPGGPKRLKQVSCPQCGGSKLMPPKTAYVYCDFCGSLIDWDFKIACSTAGSAKPGPAYEALARKEKPAQDAALAAGDRDAYAAVTRRLFDAHFDACKGAWSPRLGDPEYRAALLENTVQSYTAAAFDPDCKAKEAAMMAAVSGLKWIPGLQPKAEATSFANLLTAFRAHNARFLELGEPFLDGHPDHPTLALQKATSASAFAQGWLPYLDKPAQDAMLAELGLDGTYVDVPPVEAQERHCGGCARTLRVAPGAKKVVCEDCGHTNDVAHPEITCTNCAGPVSVIWSKRSFQCPSCATELRVD